MSILCHYSCATSKINFRLHTATRVSSWGPDLDHNCSVKHPIDTNEKSPLVWLPKFQFSFCPGLSWSTSRTGVQTKIKPSVQFHKREISFQSGVYRNARCNCTRKTSGGCANAVTIDHEGAMGSG
ncbi:hypothetical protein CDAR_379021 [Caerostris darwini]|uniref:Uncharacterized protein n=1 Tax=Caerostris darwini TaxID=1538125 RepID=A0AAV4TXB9_9ARAC|nr:hypothetical protein CDAR_379021 [Caerostris darwini]